MELLATLNAEQHAAVTAPPGPVLVRAGAGTGKTRVLTMRIAYLIEQWQVPAERVLALTFTNKAANELRSRLSTLLSRRSRGLTSGTFHAVCTRILRADITNRLGHYTADFSIYATDEQLQIATEALETATDRPPTQLDPDDLLRQISRAKSRLLTPRALARSASDPITTFVAGCYRRYQRSLERANALDFDDLIMLTHRLFSEHPDLLDRYQERWHHVLVDEYQDTDPSQHALLELLARPMLDYTEQQRSLFVVGDGMQAIYGFRNADHTIIARFTQDFPTAQEYNLTTNYRSHQPILDAAYAVIQHSRSVRPMALASASDLRPTEGSLFIQECRNGRDEASQIAQQIDDLLRQGRQPSDIAVLYRSRHMSRALETALRQLRVPYRVRGSTSFYDRAVIRDTLAYLRAIVNPADSLSLSRIANRPARGLSAQALAGFASFAARNSLSLDVALTQRTAQAQVSRKAAEGARSLSNLLARWRRLLASGSYPPDHLVSDVLEQSGYMAALTQRLEPEELSDAHAHLQELVEAAGEHTNLRSFLQEVALLTSADNEDENDHRVDLLTIHAAKGLEWPLVFVAGLEEGTLPHERSLTTADGLEEERRLCYVALTRAGEKLFLSWSPQRNRDKTSQPSRFLAEIRAYGRQRAQQQAVR